VKSQLPVKLVCGLADEVVLCDVERSAESDVVAADDLEVVPVSVKTAWSSYQILSLLPTAYDREIRDAILTCNQQLSLVGLIYRTESKTKKSKNRKK